MLIHIHCSVTWGEAYQANLISLPLKMCMCQTSATPATETREPGTFIRSGRSRVFQDASSFLIFGRLADLIRMNFLRVLPIGYPESFHEILFWMRSHADIGPHKSHTLYSLVGVYTHSTTM